MTLTGCQRILFEAYDAAGSFITSDNPAFEHKTFIERQNSSGIVFPISPKYFIFFAKGDEGINIANHKFVVKHTIKHFNRIIAQHKTDTLISVSKNIKDAI